MKTFMVCQNQDTPITVAHLNRKGSTGPATMRQFVNVLQFIGASEAVVASALLNQKLKHCGTWSLFLGLSLNPGQRRQLFIDKGTPHDWIHTSTHYAASSALSTPVSTRILRISTT